MKRALSILLAMALVLGSAAALADKALPTAEPTYTPGPNDYVFTEESGGHFEPIPIPIENNGAPLPKEVKYNAKIKIYQDPTIRVERHTGHSSYFGCNYYYMLIEIKDPSQIRTTSADESFSKSAAVPTVTMAKKKNAVAAINGDYCLNFAGVVSRNIIFRQGQLYRDTVDPNLDMLIIDEDGDFHILPAPDTDFESIDKTMINGKKVINAFQFGPAMVIDGEKVADEIINDDKHAPGYTRAKGRTQRMCIAQIDTLKYLVLTVANAGLPLCDLRDFAMTIAPCKVVYNLDGGESAQMVFLGKKFNNVKKGVQQRQVTDAIWFASAWFYD